MDSTEARKIWGPEMPQDVLEEWVRAVNKRKKAQKAATRQWPLGVIVVLLAPVIFALRKF
jgi:hypothetical protein